MSLGWREMEQECFADVALGIPSAGPFQYSIPKALRESAIPGVRAFVQMRNRLVVGTIVSLSDIRAVSDVKPIDSLVGEGPLVTPSLMQLTRWMADYYACSWGQAIDATLPAPFKRGKMVIKQRSQTTAKARSALTEDLELTADQTAVYQKILASSEGSTHSTFLLHGVTGSGKTEVYIQLIRRLLEKNRSSIVLVPEISLTPQTVGRFCARFGETVAVIHSRLSEGQRLSEWNRIRRGDARIVVGARSAVFSPVVNLGLIVLDEEHETSYKQEDAPRYHAREVATKRIEIEGGTLLLGSATPSLETYHASTKGAITRLTLPKRIENRPLPEVEIVDMRRQRETKREPVFSATLESALSQMLQKNEQAMLLLNRRGFSTYLHCASCGYVMTCPHCRISLAYHQDKGSLLCHLCHHEELTTRLCPGCQKNYLHYFGMGTQKVEQEVRRLFPQARLGRMDTDSTSRKDSHEHILQAFKNREIDVLIGTQMIAKGHDFPNVSLIGVVSADTALHIPDFRSSERTFDLLTQVAGRTGRGDVPGKVIIQTFVPHHYAIQSAKDHDFLEFYEKEIMLRQELDMPPFSHLIQVVVRGADEKNVVRHILQMTKALREAVKGQALQLLGPAPCLHSKGRGQYRWHFFIKGPEVFGIHQVLGPYLRIFKKKAVTISLDVDPL